ncbi:MAG TPA: hypothetical protein VFE61_04090 [Candidatus Sulfotelmatobacter sp.]|jgi:hypothetical protein|nr:hypothetical protein [Candidatus Sulfotelmatobacter sp.]
MFVGRLLTDIYHPPVPGMYKSFDQVFFSTQYTTALLYDPLLPLFRQAERDAKVKDALGHVLSNFFAWSAARQIDDVRKYRHEIAHFVGEQMLRYGLTRKYAGLVQGGHVKPETLLFTAFGIPGHIELA